LSALRARSFGAALLRRASERSREHESRTFFVQSVRLMQGKCVIFRAVSLGARVPSVVHLQE
jgi:hypothetical protein